MTPESVRYYFLGFVLALFFLGLFILFLSILYSNRQIRNKKEKVEIQSHFSQTLLQSQLEIQEQTLRHISYELHDNLGQVASLIKINLNTIQLNDISKAQQRLEDTKELTRQLIADLKALSVSLGGERIAQLGLEKALEIEVERLNKIEAFSVSLSKEGILPALDLDQATILYRMAQECINNIVKHSQAKNITLSLKTNENIFTLVLADDGIGFDVDEKILANGAGLKNLQNRARLINASFAITSTPGNGTCFNIQLIL